MKALSRSLFFVLASIAGTPVVQASPSPEFCRVLRAFVMSVQPNESREFTFRTSWGSNFKGAAEPALFARRCEPHGYAPAEKVCAYLMESGSTEFSGENVKDTIACLSRKTRFDPRLSLNEANFDFNYGSESSGALINITFKEDPAVGGMALRLVADGY